jgi:hypothetical protein
LGEMQAVEAPSDTALLKWLTDCLEGLAQSAHEKMTVRQALFFVAVAHKSSLGQTTTVPAIRAEYPLGRSIAKSKALLLEATPQNPQGLGWIRQEIDPADRRHRYLATGRAGGRVLAALPYRPRPLTIADILRRVREARGAP